jgi:hypothetical protein
MKHRGLFVVGAVIMALCLTPSAASPQSSPNDDPNPPWKDELMKKPTPRRPDGKPDLSGMWQRSQASIDLKYSVSNYGERGVAQSGIGVQFWKGRGEVKGAQSFINLERDHGVRLRGETNKPLYKPEHWERIRFLDENGNKEDPDFVCLPMGVPRMGPPDRIVQTPKELFFFYTRHNTNRIIPMNKPLPPVEEWIGESWVGTPSGRWEGDTLVIESVDFAGDAAWLDFPGYVSSYEKRVTERYTRTGDVIKWEVRVEDPEMLIEPWHPNPWYLRVHPDPNAELRVSTPCRDTSAPHIGKERG